MQISSKRVNGGGTEQLNTSWFVSECPGDDLTKNFSFYLEANNSWPCWKETLNELQYFKSARMTKCVPTMLFLKFNKTKHNFLLYSANTRWWVQWFPTLIASGSQFTLPYREKKSFTEHDFGVRNLKSPVTAVVVQVAPKKEIHKKAFRELWLCSCPHNEIALWHVNWARRAAAVPYLCTQLHTAVLILRKHLFTAEDASIQLIVRNTTTGLAHTLLASTL